MKISLCTQVYNRNSFLQKSLPTWLCRDFSEIVIFNWYTEDQCPIVQDPRVKIIRLQDDIPYNIAIAKNSALRAAENNVIMYLDCDIQLTNEFPDISSLEISPECFYMSRTAKIDPANGSMFLMKEQYLSVNGFNERLTDYGYEEYDFTFRLKDKGYVWKYLPYGMNHLHHTDVLRSTNYQEKDIFLSYLKNALKAKDKPWTVNDQQRIHNVRIDSISGSIETKM